MVAVPRAVQYLFPPAGRVLLGVGTSMAHQKVPRSSVELTWTCTGADGRQQCAPDANGDIDDITTYDAQDTGLAVCIAGVGLPAASVPVAPTGRGCTPAAPGAASAGP
ncbi:hypothetical protein GCM10018793_00890 [Streptomyces sulfonofaciens]|uniref:Uncharacterized protein n=1 Tax=Streptomyces sulfonofaciens TaxID=68272 RepID=A0A919FNJ2_9ACTN|nr:hypothetical protein [Streptomyces sulfonofaciens]GHH69048.1 hypothetical protein GCM10018793_00890 [Streptomyces sulfonofaciens]